MIAAIHTVSIYPAFFLYCLIYLLSRLLLHLQLIVLPPLRQRLGQVSRTASACTGGAGMVCKLDLDASVVEKGGGSATRMFAKRRSLLRIIRMSQMYE